MRQDQLPRCDNLDGSTLSIKPEYTEAGAHCEANCVTVVDAGGREAVYVPLQTTIEKIAKMAETSTGCYTPEFSKRDVEVMEITRAGIADAVRTIFGDGQRECDNCDGTGAVDTPASTDEPGCEECSGEGIIE